MLTDLRFYKQVSTFICCKERVNTKIVNKRECEGEGVTDGRVNDDGNLMGIMNGVCHDPSHQSPCDFLQHSVTNLSRSNAQVLQTCLP